MNISRNKSVKKYDKLINALQFLSFVFMFAIWQTINLAAFIPAAQSR